MDIRFSVALNTPAQQRDFEINAGDDYRLIVDVYADEADTTVDPLTLVGMTLTFEHGGYPSNTATAVGNVFTFDDTPGPYRIPRQSFRIVMTDGSNLRTTLCYGYVVTRRLHMHCWGLLGNDYGWWYP